MNNIINQVQNNNPTLSFFVNKNNLKRNSLLKYLREKSIIDDDHIPYEPYEDWFEVRTNNPWSDRCFLSLTPKGEVEILKFANKLKDEDGINIFK